MMRQCNILILQFLLVVFPAHSMQLDLDQRLIQTADSEEKEYFVLFRGIHFGKDMKDESKTSIKYDSYQAVDSRYVSLSKDSNNVLQRRTLALEKLKKLRRSGPYPPQAQSNGTQSVLPYPSAYHWILELYVNKYGDFQEQLANSESELSQLLRRNQLSFDDIFFVSTSLNAQTAVKYALGLCSGEHRGWPAWKADEKGVEMQLGYLDVFIIPRSDLTALGAFPVVEEFSLSTIQLEHKVIQKNYTVAEEYVFPLSLPCKYHKIRLPVVVKKIRGMKKDDFLKDFLSRQAKKITKTVSSKVEELQRKERGRRAFLYLLHNRFEDANDRLLPSEAVRLNKDVEPLLIKTYEEIRSDGRSSHGDLTLPSCIAIERIITGCGNNAFSLQFDDDKKSTMGHIAALVRHQNLNRVIIGAKKDFEIVGDLCLGMGGYKYDEQPSELGFVIEAAAKREKPITFVIAFLIDPESKIGFDNLSNNSKGKIQFEYDRQNYDAQAFECVEAEALYGLPDDLRAVLVPTCFSVENIVETFVGKIEALVDEFSYDLCLCEGFDSDALYYRLDFDELRYENYDIPNVPHEAVSFIEEYGKRAKKFLSNYELFERVEEYLEDEYQEDEALSDRLYYAFDKCYQELKETFIRKVRSLIAESVGNLESIVEFDNGDQEQESSSDGGERFFGGGSRKRVGRPSIWLHAEYLEQGTILKKRA